MEVVPGIHRIEAPLGDRFVAMYLLVGDDCALLLDTGLDRMPHDYIVPYLDQISLPASQIRYVINSHADFDHTAGNASVKEIAPQAIFLCHALDQPLVEDIERMISDRYGEFAADHGIDETEESKQFIRDSSRPVPIDIALSGGEKIRLGSDWTIEILHTPGHSRGHLTLHDPRSSTLIICDATLWNAVLRKDGKPAFPPTYRYVDTYVATMGRFAGMKPKMILTSHYPLYTGTGVDEFLAESRAYVDRVDAALLHAIGNAATPPTMRELTEQLGASLGEWPAAAGIYLVNPFQGHLERLVQYGLVETGRRAGLMTYQMRLPR
ncbi:MAG: MBL fold metallo-hydrolase [Chloroflexota bacterium]|nr:MBL fold metallo-hydrolase [Chloroflexota bacterium]